MPNDCLFCGRIFSTPQGLGQHRRHGCKNGPKASPTPPVAPSNSSGLLNAELYDALDEWFESLRVMMIVNDCVLAELIGAEDKDLGRIYKAYQAIKATGI